MIIIKFPKLSAESFMDEKLEQNIKGIPNFVANSKNFEKTFCFYDE